MASQAWILLCCTLLSVSLGSYGLNFEIIGSKGSHYCARAICRNDVNKDVNSYHATRITIYDVADSGARIKLASISESDPQLAIDTNRAKVVNGTGRITKDSAGITLDFQSQADCEHGTYVCELEFVGVKGKREVISETVMPGEQSGECSCSSITQQFISLTNRANDIDRQVSIQREVNGDINNDIRDLRQELREKQNMIDKLSHDNEVIVETVNSLRQSNKDTKDEIAVQTRSDNFLSQFIQELQNNDAKQEKAIAELRSKDDAKEAAIAALRQNDRNAEGFINERRRNDAKFADDIVQLTRKDASLDDHIEELRGIHRGLLEEVFNLKQRDENIYDEIEALQKNGQAQKQAVTVLTQSFQGQASQIKNLQEADARFLAYLADIKANNTAFDTTILTLRKNTQRYVQELAAARRNNEMTNNRIDLFTSTDSKIDSDTADLNRVDASLQDQIDDLKNKDKTISNTLSTLVSSDAVLLAKIESQRSAFAALQARASNQSRMFANIQQQILVLRQSNTDFMSRLEQMAQQIVLIRHAINASHVTTVTRTTTSLGSVQCTRGMAHTLPLENILINGIIPVLCDTETDNGGWVVIQRRVNNNEDFNRPWADYKNGFGKIASSYWLGLDAMHNITTWGFTELRVDIVFEGKDYFAHYDDFRISGEPANYKLSVSGYTGNAGDGLSYHDGAEFSTYDRDNDNSDSNCARDNGGGWWYNNCYQANPNGRLGKDAVDGVIWKPLSKTKSLDSVVIKVRSK